jgi:hypothetical protein
LTHRDRAAVRSVDEDRHPFRRARAGSTASRGVRRRPEKEDVSIDPKNRNRAFSDRQSNWPFPVPLVKRGAVVVRHRGRQKFYRRIGSDELDAMDRRGYVEACMYTRSRNATAMT